MRTPPNLAGLAAAWAACALLAACGGGGGDGDPPPAGNSLATSADIATSEDTASAGVAPTVANANGSISFQIASQPAHGTAAVVGNQLVFTPEADFSGDDSFTYSATSNSGQSAVGTAKVKVAPVNDAPTATWSGRALHYQTTTSHTPWVADPDLFDTVRVERVSDPASGTVSYSGARWTYSPAASGVFSFDYRASDSGGKGVTATARIRAYDDIARNECSQDSAVDSSGMLVQRTRANRCAFYASEVTRNRLDNSVSVPVAIDYFAHRPPGDVTPKGLVVLIGGGDLDMGLSGNATTGAADNTGGGNAVVRIAQLLANAGYATLAIDRPNDVPASGAADSVADADAYRLSLRHTIDLVHLLQRANTENLPVFLLGTSRGAASVAAQNRIATAIGITSPVTVDSRPNRFFVGMGSLPLVQKMQPDFVIRPALIAWHEKDGCEFSPPDQSEILATRFAGAGVATTAIEMTGGARMAVDSVFGGTTLRPNPCEPWDHHGFLAQEKDFANRFVTWMGGVLAGQGGNRPPLASFASFRTAQNVSRRIDLTRLARDPDGNALSFSVPETGTLLKGTVSLDKGMLSYKPPAGLTAVEDKFVYVVEDGKGGVGAAIVTIRIGS